jgi:hypothetical protein
MYKTVNWNTGAAAMRFRHNLKLKKKFNQRLKPQAASSFRMVLTNKRKYMRKAPSFKRHETDTIK